MIMEMEKKKFVAKFKGKEHIFKFLQNIKYDEFEKVNFEELNLNYRTHKLLFSGIKCDEKESDNTPLELELGYIKSINDNELEFCDYPSLSQNTPPEIEYHLDYIKDYCNGMELELIAENLNMKIHSKLIIGLGNPSILETSITLHHVYGIPYLPGQALKGLFKRYFIDEVMEEKGGENIVLNNGKTIEKVELYRMLFGKDFNSQKRENEGGQDKSGIVFFDTFPIKEFKIEKDIINTHYRNYYDEKGFPDGTEEPNIAGFYTVKDTGFKILCALNRKEFGDDYSLDLERYIVDILIEALEEQGIGAKTTSGYGYLKLVDKSIINEEFHKKRNKIIDEKLSKMNNIERKIYELESNKVNAKTELIATLVKDLESNDVYSSEDKKKLAEYAKEFYENTDRWKIRKKKKTNNIISIICKILECDLPI